MLKRDSEESTSSLQKSITTSPATMANTPALTGSNSTAAKAPPQKNENKRRRVTRACDTCRQKKVKCDGKQPCIHCTVYSYKCTYDQPNIRNKKNSGIPIPSQPSPAILQVAAQAAAAFGTHSPENGNNDHLAHQLQQHLPLNESFPKTNLIIFQQIVNALFPKLQVNGFDPNLQIDLHKFQKAIQYITQKSPTFALNLNEISDLMQDPNAVIPPKRTLSVGSYDDPGSTSMSSPREVGLYLPTKEVALKLIHTTWNKACVLFRFYHRPSLLEEVDLLYSLDPANYGDRQQKFLPFLYCILACGSLFSKTPYGEQQDDKSLEDDGFKYFLEARKLIDISNVGDINSIQTIVMMIIYLQCSARLSTCYSYIGIALRSALKEGLHRNLTIFQNSKRKLDPIEEDTRKRLFYTIYKMDIYINSLLGLPRSLNEDEFDQELPAELDDENVTRDAYLYDKQEGRLSSSGCANQHTKLMMILSHIIRKMYPIKVRDGNSEEFQSTSSANYSRDRIHAKVTDLEVELKNWLDNLPQELKPTDPSSTTADGIDEIPGSFKLANYYLHLAFLNCQIILYRPFIHFISDSMDASSSDPRSLIRGRNCIKVARMVVKLANKMIDQKLLLGTYWFSMYTIFFSIACLIYYFHFANYNNNGKGYNYAGILFDDDLNIDMIKKDIEIGKKVLDSLKNSSNSSLRIYNILNTMFEQLNRRTATRSRQTSAVVSASASSTTTTAAAPMTSSASGENAVAIPAQFQSQNVKTTFKNFDNMNQYAKKDQVPQDQYGKKESLGQLFDTTSQAKWAAGSDLPKEVANLQRVESPKEEENKEIGGVAGGNLTSDYMPGVFDKLDAQIFGKILPPYMLEKNEDLRRSNGGGAILTNQASVGDGSGSNNWQMGNGEDGLNLEALFGSLGDTSQPGDSNGLEYLDPF
ncbi:Activator of stress genes protein 1 [Candida viswanathii]|uniref:Activator of stress genes protein 1 n=1 Tax=Candida viswanathii TaxID=5486 RepID=A0A367Y0B4_9ASCO|nr:Activator of stress genes protein 1 [Candida viswanathii]